MISALFATAFHVQRWQQEHPSRPALVQAVARKPAPPKPIPDFAAMQDVELRKAMFFDFLEPYITSENKSILEQRQVLEGFIAKLLQGQRLTRRQRALVSGISEEYELDSLRQDSVSHLRQLLRRVDIIPTSLVLAQAANESAWGTSRFTIEGNNLFGQWCYSQGCGIVPEQRVADAIHEVQAFGSVAESVHAYFMNINTFPSYQKLRRTRQLLRDQGKVIDGLALVSGLEEYSERGQEYVEELRSMIDFNQLLRRDRVELDLASNGS